MNVLNCTEIPSNWTDKYVGERWTNQQNCYYWTARMLLETVKWELPVISEETSSYSRARILLKEEKESWVRTNSPKKNFDVIVMKIKGNQTNSYHIGVWTTANKGAVCHAVDDDFISLDSSVELGLRGFEIKRVLRHKDNG